MTNILLCVDKSQYLFYTLLLKSVSDRSRLFFLILQNTNGKQSPYFIDHLNKMQLITDLLVSDGADLLYAGQQRLISML